MFDVEDCIYVKKIEYNNVNIFFSFCKKKLLAAELIFDFFGSYESYDV